MADQGSDGGDRNVDQIRDILFGGQMRDYERRFGELQQRLELEAGRLREETGRALAELDGRLAEEIEKLGKQLRQEIGDRSQAVDDLETRTQQAARTARNEIGAQIAQLQQDLAAAGERHRRQLADLGAELKRAVAEAETALAAARNELRGEKVGRDDLAAMFAEIALRLRGDIEPPPGNR